MPRPSPGEVWRVDLGLAAKVRPCLVLSDYPDDDELALMIVVPHTTSGRSNRWELRHSQVVPRTGRVSFATGPARIPAAFGAETRHSIRR